MMFRENLPRFDGDLQVIFLRREGAGGELGERTGRTVGFIEVDVYVSVFMGVGVMIATGWICWVAVRQIHELDEQTAVRQLLDDELMFLSVYFKREIALHRFIQNGAEDIRHLDHLWGRVANIQGRDAKLFLDGIPFPGGEGTACLAGVIPDADPTPFERRTTTMRMSWNVRKLGTSS